MIPYKLPNEPQILVAQVGDELPDGAITGDFVGGEFVPHGAKAPATRLPFTLSIPEPEDEGYYGMLEDLMFVQSVTAKYVKGIPDRLQYDVMMATKNVIMACMKEYTRGEANELLRQLSIPQYQMVITKVQEVMAARGDEKKIA